MSFDFAGLNRIWAVSFAPAEGAPSFASQPVRPAGQAVALVLRVFDFEEPVAILGVFGASVDRNGALRYTELLEHFDITRAIEVAAVDKKAKPRGSRRRKALIRQGITMANLCRRAIDKGWSTAGRTPVLPRTLCGFHPGSLPEFRDSPALRVAAASRLRCKANKLHEGVLLERMLQNIWEEYSHTPGDPASPFPAIGLVPGDFLDDKAESFVVYEDFRVYEDLEGEQPYSQLCGSPTWNPASKVAGKLLHMQQPNPAAKVLEAHGIPLQQEAFDAITMEQLDRMVRDMYKHLGRFSGLFSREAIHAALCDPATKLITADSTPAEVVEFMGEEKVAQTMRRLLPETVGNECTDRDLTLAFLNPKQPLIASGMPRIQILGTPKSGDFGFCAEGSRVSADFGALNHELVLEGLNKPLAQQLAEEQVELLGEAPLDAAEPVLDAEAAEAVVVMVVEPEIAEEVVEEPVVVGVEVANAAVEIDAT